MRYLGLAVMEQNALMAELEAMPDQNLASFRALSAELWRRDGSQEAWRQVRDRR